MRMTTASRGRIRVHVAPCASLVVNSNAKCGSSGDFDFDFDFPACAVDFIQNALPHRPKLWINDKDAWCEHWRRAFKDACSSDEATTEDRLEFIKSGKSMGQELEWRILEIPPRQTFPTHAHIGLEFYYILSGTLHETKLLGEPIERNLFVGGAMIDPPDYRCGSSSTAAARLYAERTFTSGACNVNEVGSLHQTYTKDEECVLLVLGCGKILPIPDHRLPRGHPFQCDQTLDASKREW